MFAYKDKRNAIKEDIPTRYTALVCFCLAISLYDPSTLTVTYTF